MKVYAFDVDETLELSNGPVTLAMMAQLRSEGHIVGICGNMQVFCRVPDWHQRIAFLGQGYVPKPVFLWGLSQNIQAEQYIMVGNIKGTKNKLGFVCQSEDNIAAAQAQWYFIKEDYFAEGAR